MSMKNFTEDEKKELRRNPYIKNVGDRVITYTKEFKELYLKERENGKRTTEIFKNAGFDTKLIGRNRMDNFGKRVIKKGVEDTRKGHSGRPRKYEKVEPTIEEQIELLKHKNALLEQENEFLKKMIFLGKEFAWLKSQQVNDTK